MSRRDKKKFSVNKNTEPSQSDEVNQETSRGNTPTIQAVDESAFLEEEFEEEQEEFEEENEYEDVEVTDEPEINEVVEETPVSDKKDEISKMIDQRAMARIRRMG